MSKDNLSARMRPRTAAEAKPVRDVLSAPGADVRRMTIYLPTDDARSLKKMAAEHDTSMSALIANMVRELLEREE